MRNNGSKRWRLSWFIWPQKRKWSEIFALFLLLLLLLSRSDRNVRVAARSVTSSWTDADIICVVVSSGLFPLEGSRTEVGGKCWLTVTELNWNNDGVGCWAEEKAGGFDPEIHAPVNPLLPRNLLKPGVLHESHLRFWISFHLGSFNGSAVNRKPSHCMYVTYCI